jgi:hypothetical protein
VVEEALALPGVAEALAAHDYNELVEVYLCWVFNRCALPLLPIIPSALLIAPARRRRRGAAHPA